MIIKDMPRATVTQIKLTEELDPELKERSRKI
jgi:hypothetical protein